MVLSRERWGGKVKEFNLLFLRGDLGGVGGLFAEGG
jgi:hypothetical protein